VIPLLRFIDCLSWDRASTLDERRDMPSLKLDYITALCKIAQKTADLQVIKQVALVFGNSPKLRAMPADEAASNNLLVKFLTLAEAGEQCFEEGADTWCGKLASGFSIRLELAPDKVVFNDAKQYAPIDAIIEEEEREDSDS